MARLVEKSGVEHIEKEEKGGVMDFRAILSNGAYPTPTPPTSVQRAALGVSYGLLMGPLAQGSLFRVGRSLQLGLSLYL